MNEDLRSLCSEAGSGVYHGCFRLYFARKKWISRGKSNGSNLEAWNLLNARLLQEGHLLT